MNSDRLHSAMMCSRQRRTTEINSSSSSKGGCKISVNTHPEAWSWTLLPQSRLKTVLSSFFKKRIHVHNSCCVIIAHVFSHRTRGELTFQFIVRTCQWIFFWYLLKQSTQVVFRQQKLHFVCQINIKENIILHVWRDKEFHFLRRASDIKDVASEHPRKQTNKSFTSCEHIDAEHTSAPQTAQQEITDGAVHHCCCSHEIQKLIALFLNPSWGEKCSTSRLSGSGATPLFHCQWSEGSWNGAAGPNVCV